MRPPESEKELVVEDSKDNEADFERLMEMDQEFPEAFDDGPRRSANRMEEMASRKHDAMANIAARAETLQHYLEMQLGELELEDDLLEMTERIVTSLDSNGYLTSSLEDLLPPDANEEHPRPGPAGPGNRAVARAAWRRSPRSARMPVAATRSRACPVRRGQDADFGAPGGSSRQSAARRFSARPATHSRGFRQAWDQLRKLNPKPGADFTASIAPTVTPDVFLDRQDDGTYKVRLEEGRTPSLRISNYYRKRLMSGEATPEEREFIKRKINAAQWLIESIEQRRSTLTRVAQAIVDHQTRFIEEGPEAIEPLKMQQIADKVGVHVTTVSRAVDDKWIQTPRGIFPLKRFFVGGTKSDDGEDVAWDAIRIKLQEVVDHEDKTKPFSDDELVRQLKKHGLNVARRTITKYRRKMGIPSSRQRRDWSKSPSASFSRRRHRERPRIGLGSRAPDFRFPRPHPAVTSPARRHRRRCRASRSPANLT